MDAVHPSAALLRAEYRLLSRVNHVARAAEHLLDAMLQHRVLAEGGTASVVDFGSGGGDIPRRLVDLSRKSGLRVGVLCTDVSAQAVEMARSSCQGGCDYRVLDVRDAVGALGAKSFDVAHASLVLHHLDDSDVLAALDAMRSVSRRIMVWNDLIRDRIGIVGAFASTAFSRREIRRDATLSVRRSFTIPEVRALTEAAGWEQVHVRRVRAGRFVAVGVPGQSRPLMRPMLRVERLSCRIGGRPVFAGVEVVAHGGEVLHVTGPNGSGKSTFLRCIVGARSADSGSAWLDRSGGAPGYHPQEGGLMGGLRVIDHLAWSARISGVPGHQVHERVRAAVARFGLESSAQMRVSQLSGGTRRRAALAASVVHAPAVIVLDEPDAGLDAAGLEMLCAEVSRVQRSGGLVVIAAHGAARERVLAGMPNVVTLPLNGVAAR
jgi:heme exporter protein A